jgi:hypothetical protein
MDWVTPSLMQASWKLRAVYSPPPSVCSTTPSTAPPRTATAIVNAA